MALLTDHRVYQDAGVHDTGAHCVDGISPTKHVPAQDRRIDKLQVRRRWHLARESGEVSLQALTNLERTSCGVHRRQELHIHNLNNLKRSTRTCQTRSRRCSVCGRKLFFDLMNSHEAARTINYILPFYRVVIVVGRSASVLTSRIIFCFVHLFPES